EMQVEELHAIANAEHRLVCLVERVEDGAIPADTLGIFGYTFLTEREVDVSNALRARHKRGEPFGQIFAPGDDKPIAARRDVGGRRIGGDKERDRTGFGDAFSVCAG